MKNEEKKQRFDNIIILLKILIILNLIAFIISSFYFFSFIIIDLLHIAKIIYFINQTLRALFGFGELFAYACVGLFLFQLIVTFKLIFMSKLDLDQDSKRFVYSCGSGSISFILMVISWVMIIQFIIGNMGVVSNRWTFIPLILQLLLVLEIIFLGRFIAKIYDFTLKELIDLGIRHIIADTKIRKEKGKVQKN